MSDPQQQAWHLDKRVPIALIFALLAQTGGIVWWASGLSSRVDVNSRDIARQSGEVAILRNAAQAQAIQLGRIEEQIAGMRGDINRMIAAFERQRP